MTKRSWKGKRKYKPKRYYRRRYTGKKYIKDVVNSMSETKSKRQNLYDGDVNYTIGGYDLCTIAQGISDDQRIGNKIRLSGWKFRFWAGASTVADASRLLRIMVVKHKSGAGNVDLPSGLTTSCVEAIDTDKYKIYYDKTIRLKNISGSRDLKVMEFWVPCKDHVEYITGAGTTGTTPQNVSYTMGLISDVASDGPEISGFCRTYWKDF